MLKLDTATSLYLRSSIFCSDASTFQNTELQLKTARVFPNFAFFEYLCNAVKDSTLVDPIY
jgi:hypothetical protein